ncbi:PREDICTED: CDP-diacylglycerol--inositol 3-phosphatidyltransferase-like [Priapulus caudatus]|uniref:CDP-diacylglycerol--inositol 3-phosphatidyltransferase n=1 Tax=Priapulus caudatus TaxID=37621 RepID=A0ABM1DYF3_PRICU|nr:PREDICTED: CDP-diacylglycerol--inositol 3-phosphatidyltransferase-like [Priapulus caudatus]
MATGSGDNNVFLFIPNIIGYARIILALVSFYYMATDCALAVWCYIISSFLDALDGHAARYFNQSSKFGAMLDMLTDRCATMCLLVTLSLFYPRWMFWFQLSMTVDISSHWLHLHSSTVSGATSHKAIDLSGNPILRLYYTSRPVLFFMCAGNEMFYSMLYICHFTVGPTLFGVGLWQLLCVLAAPVTLVKTGISLVHLVTASQNMAAIDAAERATARQEKDQ